MTRRPSPYEMPHRQVRELMSRPDADETVKRLLAAMDPAAPRPELTVMLTALAVLRARDAAERRQISHDPTQRVEATTTPEGAKGWADPAGSAHVRTGGHGLDVAPDASPDGVRAETRRHEQDGGGEPSNAPIAAEDAA